MWPLDGVRVVALEHAIAAPFCTRQLADLGARVIKIERPGTGDFARAYDERVRGLSSHFVWCNRSKESVTLDLKHQEAGRILQGLLERADVVVQNLAPGAARRFGLDYASLEDRYPRLIVCDISGYGADGPYRDKKAYDLLIQGESGFLSVTGSEAAPAKAGPSIADIAGGMYAFTNILAALIRCSRTGRGCHIDVSLLECMAEWMSFPLYYSFDGAAPPSRNDASHATIYPYGEFAISDGKCVMLGVQNEREWVSFCTNVLRLPDVARDERFASNSKRAANRDALKSLIETVFAKLTPDEITQRLNGAGIANGELKDMHEVWKHVQLQARGRWTDIETPAGRVPALFPPGQSPDSGAPMGAVPALGEHTDRVLGELGYDAAAIARLRADAVV
ncbi:MAG: CaiB/BaiF CoA transferase family protein [Steroidobacteraceae bacterium]